MELANILADNQEFLKINNIEKAMGLNKTALVRMIARKEIPEKHKKQVEDWWNNFIKSIIIVAPKKEEVKDDEKKEESIESAKSKTEEKLPEKDIKVVIEIQSKIKEWQNKKCPSYMGLQTFKNMQENEIQQLESQLK